MYEHLKCFLLKCRIIVITNILGNITREYLQILNIYKYWELLLRAVCTWKS